MTRIFFIYNYESDKSETIRSKIESMWHQVLLNPSNCLINSESRAEILKTSRKVQSNLDMVNDWGPIVDSGFCEISLERGYLALVGVCQRLTIGRTVVRLDYKQVDYKKVLL